ncbi:hypothetical protein HPB47_022695 [Ixodes persulcatus]|uniref:Uncharacterized protein n=1 Tax=Ixodes persulcatus TaxID=34615 RepID=A0AC60Q9I2_IXOPE|nr:hypothetical protein HPB47_022695 [Ixodes persulcatus]
MGFPMREKRKRGLANIDAVMDESLVLSSSSPPPPSMNSPSRPTRNDRKKRKKFEGNESNVENIDVVTVKQIESLNDSANPWGEDERVVTAATTTEDTWLEAACSSHHPRLKLVIIRSEICGSASSLERFRARRNRSVNFGRSPRKYRPQRITAHARRGPSTSAV